MLITDVNMPGVSGIELAQQVARQMPTCRIILFSGHVDTAPLLAAAPKRVRVRMFGKARVSRGASRPDSIRCALIHVSKIFFIGLACRLRAKERLKIILPVVFLIIFLLLYIVFHSAVEDDYEPAIDSLTISLVQALIARDPLVLLKTKLGPIRHSNQDGDRHRSVSHGLG